MKLFSVNTTKMFFILSENRFLVRCRDGTNENLFNIAQEVVRLRNLLEMLKLGTYGQ